MRIAFGPVECNQKRLENASGTTSSSGPATTFCRPNHASAVSATEHTASEATRQFGSTATDRVPLWSPCFFIMEQGIRTCCDCWYQTMKLTGDGKTMTDTDVLSSRLLLASLSVASVTAIPEFVRCSAQVNDFPPLYDLLISPNPYSYSTSTLHIIILPSRASSLPGYFVRISFSYLFLSQRAIPSRRLHTYRSPSRSTLTATFQNHRILRISLTYT